MTLLKITPSPTNEECKEGGTEFRVGTGAPTFACNGEGGSGGGFPSTLPSGDTETGFWSPAPTAAEIFPAGDVLATISFNIPLGAEPKEEVFIGLHAEAEEKAKCPGEAAEPQAMPGVLCFYYFTASEGTTPSADAFKSGAFLTFEEAQPTVFGSWAVTAE